MRTPEARVKAKLKKMLDPKGFQFWPVPSGYGKQMVDCLFFLREATYYSSVFAIECKRQGVTKPTPRQAAIMRELRKVGVQTFVVTMRDDGELDWHEQKD